jgi:DNA polymerase-3 subunit epsilon
LGALESAVAAVRGIETVSQDTVLVQRAREALAHGALDAVSLMARVCALPGAPPRVAERLAEALFARHEDFGRDPSGRWCLIDPTARAGPKGGERDDKRAPAGNGERAGASAGRHAGELQLAIDGEGGGTVRARRARATGAYEEDVSLRDLRFAVVDVETTGTSPSRSDRVTEVAVVQVANGAVAGCFETLVNPGRPIPPAIVALTRITDEMVRGAPTFRDVAGDVVQQLRDRVFVAHNAAFDWRFVSHEVQRAAGVQLVGETLCTVRLARVLLPQLPRRSLDAVTHYFGIEIGARHRAAGDALATAHVLLRLLQLAESRGAVTWRELVALLHAGRSRATRRRSALPRPVDLDPTI